MLSILENRLRKLAGAACCAVAMLAAWPCPAADPDGASKTAAVSARDELFLKTAAVAGMEEVRAGELAAARARHPEVRDFANQMLKDHGANGQELKTLARSKGVVLAETLPDSSQEKLFNLKKTHEADFDHEYMTQFGVNAHGEAQKLFQDAADHGDDPDVRAYAATSLAVINRHLETARALAGKEQP